MEEKPNYYAIIPSNVRYCNDLTFGARIIYGEITALSNKYGYCYASNSYFAKLFDVTETTISIWVNDLAKRGFVKTEIDTINGNKRKIFIVDPMQKNLMTYTENSNDPYTEKSKDNNTSKNIKQNTLVKESEVVEKWNEFAEKNNLQKISKLTNKRISSINHRLQENDFDLQKILEKISQSDFLLGKKSSWKVTFDFVFCSANNYIKILEGNYANTNTAIKQIQTTKYTGFDGDKYKRLLEKNRT